MINLIGNPAHGEKHERTVFFKATVRGGIRAHNFLAGHLALWVASFGEHTGRADNIAGSQKIHAAHDLT